MKWIKSLFSNPFTLNAKHKGIMFSLILHMGILMTLFSMPGIKNTPRLQTIQITFQKESELSTEMHKSNVVKLQQPERITAPKHRQVIIKKTNDINHHQSTPRVENNRITLADKALSEYPPLAKESINVEAISEKSDSRNNPSITPQDNLNASNLSDGKSQKNINEARFGEKGSPSFIHQENPVYPQLARRLGKEGRVILKLLIDANGTLQKVEVMEAAGFGFTEASVEAVKKSTYAPGYRDGAKVPTLAILPVSFRLQ